MERSWKILGPWRAPWIYDLSYQWQVVCDRRIDRRLFVTVRYRSLRSFNPCLEHSDYDRNKRFIKDHDLSDPETVPESYGSGVVLSASGLVLTNAHVVRNATKVFVRLPGNKGSYADIHASDAWNLAVGPIAAKRSNSRSRPPAVRSRTTAPPPPSKTPVHGVLSEHTTGQDADKLSAMTCPKFSPRVGKTNAS